MGFLQLVILLIIDVIIICSSFDKLYRCFTLTKMEQNLQKTGLDGICILKFQQSYEAFS